MAAGISANGAQRCRCEYLFSTQGSRLDRREPLREGGGGRGGVRGAGRGGRGRRGVRRGVCMDGVAAG